MEKGLEDLLQKCEKQEEKMNELALLLKQQDLEIEKEYEKLVTLQNKLKEKRIRAVLNSDLKLNISSKNVETLIKETEDLRKISKVVNPKNSGRKTPDKSALLVKIPDEIFRYITQTFKAVENIPIIYKNSDSNAEPWLEGNITTCRFRYGMDTMKVTDKRTQENLVVPYDSIAIKTDKKPDLVKSLSLCQRIPKTDLDSEDLSDNAIVPLFRTHRVLVTSTRKSAWIISKVDEDHFYICYDDIFTLSRDKSDIQNAAHTAEIEAKVRHELEFNDQLYSENKRGPQISDFLKKYGFDAQKSINGIDKVRYDQIIPIMGQLFFYDGSEKLAINDFGDHFPHLWNAPLMLTRIRKFDSQYNDQRKHSKWQQWYDTTYSLLVNKKSEISETLTFIYENLNLNVGEKILLHTNQLVEVVEIDPFLVFFKVRYSHGFEEWLHPVSVNLPISQQKVEKFNDTTTIWNEVEISKIKEASLPKIPKREPVSKKPSDVLSETSLLKSDQVNKEDEKIENLQNLEELSLECASSLDSAASTDSTNFPLIYKKKTIRNKVEITMQNLPEILTNPLDSKLPSEFHNTGPLLLPLNFSRYYGNWNRSLYVKTVDNKPTNKIMYSYNGHKIYNEKQLLPHLEDCNSQVYWRVWCFSKKD